MNRGWIDRAAARQSFPTVEEYFWGGNQSPSNPNIVEDASGVGYVDPDGCGDRHTWMRVRTEDGRTGALLCRDCQSSLWQQPDDGDAA